MIKYIVEGVKIFLIKKWFFLTA